MTLCWSCNDVLRSEGKFHVDLVDPIHTAHRSFLAAVNEGCYICHGLFSQLSEEWKQELHRQAGEELRKQDDDEHIIRSITWYNRHSPDSRTGSVGLLLHTAGVNIETPAQDLYKPRIPLMSISQVEIACVQKPGSALLPWIVSSRSTNSEETFSKIQNWLDTCDKTHAECHAHRYVGRDEADKAWHPKRLIQIISEPQGSSKAEDLVCRVVEAKSDEMPQNLRYVTLSHRWPQNQHDFQKLTLDNLPHWKTSLPINTLRKTFRDAFLVVHGLGINYIWIDSLCIIQDGDDFADWKKESPMMHKVYSQAEFNICASKKVQNENDEGLFSSRDPASIQLLQIDLDGPCLITKDTPIGVWKGNMENSPLSFRGWVFQEQLLSRANIHFCSDEVFFECMETAASESLGSQKDYKEVWSEWHSFFKQNLRLPDSPERRRENPPTASHAPYQCWHELLERYTARQLTKFDDRLVALSGVAQYFKKIIPHNEFYVGGLWLSRLPIELLWYVKGRREDWREREKARRDMTISWISAVGEIRNEAGLRGSPDDPDTHILVGSELIKQRMLSGTAHVTLPVCEEQPFAEDIFSLASMPRVEVRLTGYLRPIRLRRDRSDARKPKCGWALTRDWDLELRVGRHLVEGDTRLDFEIASSDLSSLSDSGRLFLMPLAAVRGTMWSLMLELVETSDRTIMKRFQRIGVHSLDAGVATSSKKDWVPKHLFKTRATSDAPYEPTPVHYENLNELPFWQCDESSKKHTIFVI